MTGLANMFSGFSKGEQQDGKTAPTGGIFAGVGDAVEGAAKSAAINSLPGAGVLFEYSAKGGFSLTRNGKFAASALAAYALWRVMGGKR